MLRPHGGEGTQAAGGLNVADDADHNHGRALEDGNSLDDLLLVDLGTRLVHITGDVGHAGLVRHEGGEVAGLRVIITGEALDLAGVVVGALARQEPEGTVPGRFEFTMSADDPPQQL